MSFDSPVNGQPLENPFATPFRISGMCLVLVLAFSLSFLVPLQWVLVPVVAATALWLVFQRPLIVLGAVLAFMPLDFMAIALGKFFGLPRMTLVSVLDKEILLLLLALVLWRRNGFKPAAPDWFLLACVAIAAVRTVFDGTLVGFVTDFNFVVPYLAGRMAVLTYRQEQLWAKCAVWIAAALSMLGLIEIFIFGEGPRTMLYLAIDSETEGGALTSSFHAEGFTGMREAATMIGPNGFGAICMIALILWWVYCKNPLPATMVATGLICSVTRSAWLGTAVAILLLAVITHQTKRLLLYAAVVLALFAAAIPILGLSDYLFVNKTAQDPSAQGHQEQIVDGLKYAAEHPLGGGNAKISPVGLKEDNSITIFETTYPDFAAEYGIAAVLCFLGFLFSAFYLVWRNQSRLSYAAIGILMGMALVMVVTLPLIDRRLGCWAWFPVGLAVRAAVDRGSDREITRAQQQNG